MKIRHYLLTSKDQVKINNFITIQYYEETRELKRDVKEMKEKIQDMCNTLHRVFNERKIKVDKT